MKHLIAAAILFHRCLAIASSDPCTDATIDILDIKNLSSRHNVFYAVIGPDQELIRTRAKEWSEAGKDFNDPIGRSYIAALMQDELDERTAARHALLTKHEIVAFHVGMELSLVLRDKTTGKIERYKWPAGEKEKLGYSRWRFSNKIDAAVDTAKVGIGPPAQFDEATGMLRLDHVPGKDLWQFRERLTRSSKKEKDRWFEKFAVTAVEKLAKLHRMGYVHLDIKPSNLIVSEDIKQPENLTLIDFGTTLPMTELRTMREILQGNPYHGTEGFQTRHALQGTPGACDDLEGLYLTISRMLSETRGTTPIRFAETRPAFAPIFALLSEPLGGNPVRPIPDIEYELAKQAITNNLSPDFWATFHEQFKQRTYGQQLRILSEDPTLAKNERFMRFIATDELGHILDQGLTENRWHDDVTPTGDIRRVINSLLARINRPHLRPLPGSVEPTK